MKLHLRFHPQAWINDYAVDCDPEGEVECFVEFEGELPEDDTYDSDDLRYLEGVPIVVGGVGRAVLHFN